MTLLPKHQLRIMEPFKMSHIVEIQTEVRDLAAAHAACQRLRLEPPIEDQTRLFSGEAAV